MKLMGNNFTITVVAINHQEAKGYIALAVAEIKRIEALLTTFSEESQTAIINERAGIGPVKVEKEVLELLERCQALSELTQGAFDITYGGVDPALWNFDTKMKALPTDDEARKRIHLINYKLLKIDKISGTVFLQQKRMRIGFGGIGKGYAAEMAKKLLKNIGVPAGVINASGDLTAWGLQPDDNPWTVGIAHPDFAHTAFSYLNISNKAMATSGNYEKFVVIDGHKYSHTIHPRTGLPVTGIKSVTIIADNAELADAMTKPVSIMGIDAGLYLINQLPYLHCIIVDDNNKIFTSKGINLQ